MKRTVNHKHAGGFSLLEVIMVLAMMGLLAAGIFGIMTSTFQLSAELKAHQDRSQLQQRLIEIIEMNLMSLPATTRIELQTSQAASHYVNTLSLNSAPFAFQRSSEEQTSVQNVVIQSGRGRGGFVRVTIHYLDLDQARKFSQNDLTVLESAPSVVLVDRMKSFQWRLFDSATQRWLDVWHPTDRRPTLAELTYSFEGDSQDRKYLFWIPPRSA